MKLIKLLNKTAVAVALSVALSVGASAASGYNYRPAGRNDTATMQTHNNQFDSTAAKLAKAFDNLDSGAVAKISYSNIELVKSTDLVNIFTQAGLKADNLKVAFNNIAGKKVISQITFTKANIASLPDVIDLSVDVKATQLNKTVAKAFSNPTAAIVFGHKTTFGKEVHVAVKISLSKMDAKNIKIYSYNKTTNKYTELKNAKPFVDKYGYLHFNTAVGGNIIISSGFLKV